MRDKEQLPRGEQTFHMRTGLPPVHGKEKTPPPTKEEAADANSGAYAGETRVVEKVGRNRVLKAVLGGGALVVGGAIAYGAVPAVHRAVDSAFLDNIRGNSLSTEASVFDNSAEETTIRPNNMHFVDPDNTGQLDLNPVINKETQTIEFIFPFEMPDNTTGTIERIDLVKLNSNGLNSVTPEDFPVVPIHFKFNNIVKIVAPENAHMYLIRGNPEFGQDPNFPAQVRFYKYYPEQDTTVVWWFNSPFKEGHFVTSLPMQDFDKFVLRGTNYEKLPEVDALTEVMTTSEPNQPFELDVMAYKGKIVGPEAEIAGQDFLLEPKFQTTPTGQLTVIASRN